MSVLRVFGHFPRGGWVTLLYPQTTLLLLIGTAKNGTLAFGTPGCMVKLATSKPGPEAFWAH